MGLITFVYIILGLWLFNALQLFLNWCFIPIVKNEEPSDHPKISVVVPARNEEEAIVPALRSLGKQSYKNLEVILVNDCSEDETLALAQEIAKEYPCVRVVDGKPVPKGWLGKPHAMAQGLEVASGEYILFTDADIIHSETSIEAGLAFLQKHDGDLLSLGPSVIAGSVFEDITIGAAISMISFIPIWLFNIQKLWFAGTAAGAYILVRREAFDRAGGIESIKRAFIDDLTIGRNVKMSGGKTFLARGEHLIKLRPFPSAAALIKGTEKNLFAVFFNSVLLAFFIATIPVLVIYVAPYLMWFYCLFSKVAFDWFVISVLTTIIIFMHIVRALLLVYHDEFRWWLIPTFPIGCLIFLLLVWRAAFRTIFRRATQWRGRDYAPGGPSG